MQRLMVRPITIVRPGEKIDRYGQVTEDWENPTRTDVNGWAQPQAAEDDATESRDTQIENWFLMLPPTVDLTGSYRIEIDGRTFEVVRAPATVWTPRGPHHIEALVRHAA